MLDGSKASWKMGFDSYRSLVEGGIAMITWNGDTARIKSVDKPYAALLKDLKQRGMLEDTLVIWTGEFGRTPDNNKPRRCLLIGSRP